MTSLSPAFNTVSSGIRPGSETAQKICENPDCNMGRIISLVPKRKVAQFVFEPKIVGKPILVTGSSSVFQVDGIPVKLSDIKDSAGDGEIKTIYRIVPNRHVHVVNYVIVDSDDELTEQINNYDPVAMNKILTSQKASADQMLQHLMQGPSTSMHVSCGINSKSIPVVSTISQSSTNTNTTTKNVIQKQISSASIVPPIQLSVRTHPNLKITAVTNTISNENTKYANNISNALSIIQQTPACIKTIPLVSLQSVPSIVSLSATTAVSVATIPKATNALVSISTSPGNRITDGYFAIFVK